MTRAFDALKWAVALNGDQRFLGASWVERLLRHTRPEKKRERALQLLSLSPHYFFDRASAENGPLTRKQYREKVFREGLESRERIYQDLLAPLGVGDIVLDYGCGPGYLAKVMAADGKRVFACDISPGVIACAKVINFAPGLEYVLASDAGLAPIRDGSVDTIVSLAMVQHLNNETYDKVLKVMAAKLRAGGNLILHVQLTGGGWRTEQQWRGDRSFYGRLKWRYGLHCFARTESMHLDAVDRAGLKNARITAIKDLSNTEFPDIGLQHILTAIR